MRYEKYAQSDIGKALAELIDEPHRFIEYQLLESLGRPAVQAIAKDVAPIIDVLPTKTEREMANKFCGWYVGQCMRANRREIVNRRGRVANAPFKTGAVWRLSGEPVEVVRSLPAKCSSRVELSVKRSAGGQVQGSGDIVYSAINPTRRVHEILGIDQPIEKAFLAAREAATRRGIPYLLLLDPDNLFPQSLIGEKV